MNRKTTLIVISLLLAAAVSGSIWRTNQESRIYYIQAADTDFNSPFHLLFHRYGTVTFYQHGEWIRAYLAHYNRDELVLHKPVSSIGTGEAFTFSGSFTWGITTEGGEAAELRAMLMRNGAVSWNYIDLSVLEFDLTKASTVGFPFIPSDVLSQEGIYVLHLWQSEAFHRADGNVFHPEQLQGSEHTVILYIVFE